jgi:hypothetical protein
VAVLIEAISVVISADAIHQRYPGGWNAFVLAAPNHTLCSDNELARVGFMSPTDVETYISAHRQHNIVYEDQGTARDLVVIDQLRGPLLTCNWIEFGCVHVDNDPAKKIAVCRKRGSHSSQVFTPNGWKYEHSLSSSFGFVPLAEERKSLKFLRHENGVDIYLNELTNREVFIGRTS